MDCVPSTVPNRCCLSASAVANHGIEESLVEAIFEQNKKFFALPFEEKMKIAAKNVSHYRYAMHMQNSVHCSANLQDIKYTFYMQGFHTNEGSANCKTCLM